MTGLVESLKLQEMSIFFCLRLQICISIWQYFQKRFGPPFHSKPTRLVLLFFLSTYYPSKYRESLLDIQCGTSIQGWERYSEGCIDGFVLGIWWIFFIRFPYICKNIKRIHVLTSLLVWRVSFLSTKARLWDSSPPTRCIIYLYEISLNY